MELLPISSVATRLGVSQKVVRRLADTGVLACTRTEGGHRRFRLEDVENYQSSMRREEGIRFSPVDPEPTDQGITFP